MPTTIMRWMESIVRQFVKLMQALVAGGGLLALGMWTLHLGVRLIRVARPARNLEQGDSKKRDDRD
jgi:hypothetical protein